jgi:hypothetical protein
MAVNPLPKNAIVKILKHTVINSQAIELTQVTISSYVKGGFSIQNKNLPHTNRVKAVTYVGISRPYNITIDPVVGRSFQLYTGVGEGYQEQAIENIKGATKTAGTEETVDQAAAPVNPATLSSLTAVSALVAGALPLNAAGQPDVPRNVMITINNSTGGSLNLFLGTTTFAVVGTYQGVAQTENITFTMDAGHQAVATTKFRFKCGVLPYDNITSITCTNLPAATLSVEAGYGTVLAIPEQIAATGQFYKVTVGAIDKTTSSVVNATNDTVDVGTIADGANVLLTYTADGELPTGPLPQTTSIFFNVYVTT